MEKILVYLGSDHVIQKPKFGLQETKLNVTTDKEAARVQACLHNAAGIVNSYLLDLDTLCVKAPNQAALEGFDRFDVEIPDNSAEHHIFLCTAEALSSLEFDGASFVYC